uniref:Chromosome 17 open reading frame 64 n=1 Tax=Apteryx owenii TaxID=8824 RepID=A0A8B9PRA2_APTOW
KGSLSTPPGRTPLIRCTDDLDQDTFQICKEYLRPFKKSLRKLYLPQHVAGEKKLKYTKESVTLLGDRINMFLQQHCKPSEVRHWKKMLWRYVSLFSEMDARQLHRLYKYAKNNQMHKFLVSNRENWAPVSGEKLRKLCDAWGLREGENDAQGRPARGDGRPKEVAWLAGAGTAGVKPPYSAKRSHRRLASLQNNQEVEMDSSRVGEVGQVGPPPRRAGTETGKTAVGRATASEAAGRRTGKACLRPPTAS